MNSPSSALRHHLRRAAVVLAMIVVAATIISSGTAYSWVRLLVDRADTLVARHSLLAAIVFLLLSALSAMLAFLSTAIVVPVAIEAWGRGATFVLLWLGWLLGGVLSYLIGRYLGRPAVRWLASEERLERFERHADRALSLPRLLLLQFALPSEIPGYVLGTLQYPVRKYLTALSISELPFALGAVYLGERFLARDYLLFALVAILGLAATVAAGSIIHREKAPRPESEEGKSSSIGPPAPE